MHLAADDFVCSSREELPRQAQHLTGDDFVRSSQRECQDEAQEWHQREHGVERDDGCAVDRVVLVHRLVGPDGKFLERQATPFPCLGQAKSRERHQLPPSRGANNSLGGTSPRRSVDPAISITVPWDGCSTTAPALPAISAVI